MVTHEYINSLRSGDIIAITYPGEPEVIGLIETIEKDEYFQHYEFYLSRAIVGITPREEIRAVLDFDSMNKTNIHKPTPLQGIPLKPAPTDIQWHSIIWPDGTMSPCGEENHVRLSEYLMNEEGSK